MTFTTLQLDVSEQVATITMSRPDRMNAFNLTMLNELVTALEEVGLDENVRAVILTGEGRAFCAGADVKGVDDLLGLRQERPEREDILKLVCRVTLAIRQMPKPVVAAVNGVAAGAGANFLLACDLIVASEKGRLAENFINIGLIPDGGGTFFVPHTVGYHRAAELFFMGRILSAQEAMDLGLYNRVVPLEELGGAARDLALDLAQKPTRAIAAVKAIMNRETIRVLRAHLEEETRNQRIMVATRDATEGITAFGEKRKPTFVGK